MARSVDHRPGRRPGARRPPARSGRGLVQEAQDPLDAALLVGDDDVETDDDRPRSPAEPGLPVVGVDGTDGG
ncbi:hypothetical protein ACFPM0_05045 [Pseudonocardia sulfidoxydans]|uniref:hypothetical protein n=1 Tax=Pseudonocardia sulfidoxydans TaxID=54011 RepID=UPI003623A036